MNALFGFIKKTFVAVGVVSFLTFFAAPMVINQPVAAADLKCGVLDQSWCDKAKTGSSDVKSSGIWQIVKMIVQILTAGVGLVAVGGIIYGSILYTTAGGSQDRVKKAYGVFLNVGIGILLYAAMYGLMNWLVPGGVF